MRIKLSIPVAIFLVGISTAGAQQVIFHDDFSVAPVINGWVPSIATTNTAAGTFVSNGSTLEIDKTAGTGRVEGRIVRTIDTTGFTGVELNLGAFQSATQFEGGSFLQFNTDSLSVYVDTGGGFVPLFQRTGVWGASGPGFSDGGTGPGQTSMTPTGFLLLGAAADNNSALQVQIEGIVWAADESYFLDFFTLQGLRIEISVPVSVIDSAAITSVHHSGLPFASALANANRSSLKLLGRDINERRFRLRSGAGIGERSRRGPEVILTDAERNEFGLLFHDEYDRTPWQWFTVGDFGLAEWTPSQGLGYDGSTQSASVGAEYTGGDDWAFGFAWTYLTGDYEMLGNLGSADLAAHAVSAYASWLPSRNSYLSALYSYTLLDNELRRHSMIGVNEGSSDGDAHTFKLDGGYHFRIGDRENAAVTGPFFGFEHLSGTLDPFEESGSIRSALAFGGQSLDSTVSRLGWQFSNPMDWNGKKVTTQLRVAWEREYLQGESSTARLLQSPFATVLNGEVLSRGPEYGAAAKSPGENLDSLQIGAGVRFHLSEAWTLALDYETSFFQEDYSLHLGSVRCSYHF